MLSEPIAKPMPGRLLEQWMMNEVRDAIHYAQSETRMFYWQTNNRAEVHLLLVRGQRIVGEIGIKALSKFSVAHLSTLRSFHLEHPRRRLLVVAMVEAPYKIEAVQVLPWSHFLSGVLPQILR